MTTTLKIYIISHTIRFTTAKYTHILAIVDKQFQKIRKAFPEESLIHNMIEKFFYDFLKSNGGQQETSFPFTHFRPNLNLLSKMFSHLLQRANIQNSTNNEEKIKFFKV